MEKRPVGQMPEPLSRKEQINPSRSFRARSRNARNASRFSTSLDANGGVLKALSDPLARQSLAEHVELIEG